MNNSAFRIIVGICLAASLGPRVFAQPAPETKGWMKIEGWTLQSSANVTETGDALSNPDSRITNWHPAVVPGTVLGSLAKDKIIPDPYYGVNLRNLIGSKFRNDKVLSELPMDAESEFAVPWWYRAEFTVPADFKGKIVWLHFGGINYRADIWINGQQLANATTVAGTWRIYEFNITQLARLGAKNVIAVKVYPPKDTDDLAVSYVDWNPGSPDRYMGLFREVTLTASGPVAVRYPAVMSHLELSDTTKAQLTVVARLVNGTDKPQTGTLHGSVEDIQFSQEIELKPQETRDVVLDPGAFPQLNMQNPRLWWPAQMGTPNLYTLQLRFVVNGEDSDRTEKRFGIREITSELDSHDHRLFLVNGKKLLIRGGGWAMDLLMQKSKQRLEDEFRYVQDMGLNTIRLEGMFETEEFFDLADQKGILVMAGWSCSLWETWPKWQKEQVDVAGQSLRSQILRLRSHPSMLVWLNGSDNPPPPNIENMYLGIEREYLWPNPVISSASQQDTSITGKSGVKMTGPYEYVVPEFWTEERDDEGDRGGAFGFNTETGPGPAIPSIETLEQILPKEHLWPIDDWWTFHAGLGDFKDFHVQRRALNERYGEAANLDDFLMKSQVMRYEAIRAMYEAYTRNKYEATGVIVWMLNNGWPSFIWNLYDYELRVAGGYFGAKNALEGLHPMYGYDDRAVWVLNSEYHDADKLSLTAKIYDLNMKELFSRQANVDAAADSTNRVFTLPQISHSTPVYFLKLTLHDAAGKLVGSNFYWLTSKPETITHGIINMGDGFAQNFADFHSLNQLAKVNVKTTAQTTREHGDQVTHITLHNETQTLAFFVRLNLNVCGTGTISGKEILPILWSDNYVSLLPGEAREVTATYRADLPEPVRVDVTGWNVNHLATECAQGSP